MRALAARFGIDAAAYSQQQGGSSGGGAAGAGVPPGAAPAPGAHSGGASGGGASAHAQKHALARALGARATWAALGGELRLALGRCVRVAPHMAALVGRMSRIFFLNEAQDLSRRVDSGGVGYFVCCIGAWGSLGGASP